MSSSNTAGDTANTNAASTTVQGTASQQTIASAQTLEAVAQTTQAKVDAAAQATQSDADAQTTQSDADAQTTQSAAVVLKSLAAVTQSTNDSNADANTQAAAPSSSSDSASPTSAKASSTSDAKTTATTNASTTSNSSSSSAKATSASGATTNSSSSSSSASSTSASTSSDSSGSTAAQATQTSSPSGSLTMTASLMTSIVDGQPTTITTDVLFIPSSTQDAQSTNHAELSTTESFFNNKAAVGGTFGAVGLVSLFLLLAIVLKIVRYRARRKFEKDLDEQVERETRAGTPFGFGKEDDDIIAPGLADPEKAYGGTYANQPGPGYAMGNTAAYATYGSAAAMQPAYYSPNSSSGAMPRRYSPPQFGNGYNTGNGLSRPPSGGSGRSYGTLNQPPMNAFAPAPGGPTGPAPTFAPPTFAGNYGEYRGAHSPAPSSISNTSSTSPYLARPETPSSLTPGGGTAPMPAAPTRPYTALGSRPDSPAILARYGRSSGGSGDSSTYGAEVYSTAGLRRERSLAQTGLAVPDDRNVEPSSLHLPNPFDQRD